jgi:hypothetical protein
VTLVIGEQHLPAWQQYCAADWQAYAQAMGRPDRAIYWKCGLGHIESGFVQSGGWVANPQHQR